MWSVMLVGVYGLLIGSFLNVCICRIPEGKSIAFPPSHCGSCNNSLKWKDLIPVISYVFLGGRCRYCKSKVSILYPLIEIITAISFIILYINYGFTFYFFKFCILVCILIVISVIDIQTQDVYFITTFSGIIVGIVSLIVEYKLFNSSFVNDFLGLVIGVGVIGLIVWTTGGMGKGDIEIAGLCGIFIGWKLTILMLVISFILGAVISLALILVKKKGRKDFIAFGPFIALATFICILYGEKIVELYIKSY